MRVTGVLEGGPPSRRQGASHLTKHSRGSGDPLLAAYTSRLRGRSAGLLEGRCCWLPALAGMRMFWSRCLVAPFLRWYHLQSSAATAATHSTWHHTPMQAVTRASYTPLTVRRLSLTTAHVYASSASKTQDSCLLAPSHAQCYTDPSPGVYSVTPDHGFGADLAADYCY